MYTYSDEHIKYLKKIKKEKRVVLLIRFSIILLFLFLWELSVRLDLINGFLFSSPSNIINTILNLYNNGLFMHIWTTVYETLISFIGSFLIGLIIGTVLWWNKLIAKVFDPYLTVINSLPKVALGPLIIIWVGASINSIIFMSLLVSSILSIISIYNAFATTDESYILLLKSFKATKVQLFTSVVLPSNRLGIINALKINISMSLIGVIMGELLVSKSGLGYLIMYGSQVFNINLVITSVFLLGLVSFLMYYIISCIEKRLID